MNITKNFSKFINRFEIISDEEQRFTEHLVETKELHELECIKECIELSFCSNNFGYDHIAQQFGLSCDLTTHLSGYQIERAINKAIERLEDV